MAWPRLPKVDPTPEPRTPAHRDTIQDRSNIFVAVFFLPRPDTDKGDQNKDTPCYCSRDILRVLSHHDSINHLTQITWIEDANNFGLIKFPHRALHWDLTDIKHKSCK